MTIEQQVTDAVAARLAGVPDPLLDVDELRRRGRRQARGRTAALVLSAALVLAGTGWAATSLDGEQRSEAPVDLPRLNAGSVRPMTWADGSQIHLGQRVVEAPGQPTALEVTDYGAAFTTADGGIWFTGGEAPRRIGTTDPQLVQRWQVDPLTSQATGPELEWFEVDGDGVDVVVYDTRRDQEVGRVPTGLAPDCRGDCADVFGVSDGWLYWTDQACHDCMGFPPSRDDESKVEPTPTTHETDLGTGESRMLSSAQVRDEVRSWPRSIELRQGSGRPMDDTSDDYLVSDGTGLQLGGWPGVEVYGPAPGELVRFVVATDTAVQFRGEGPQPAQTDYYLTQWLDDDTVALGAHRWTPEGAPLYSSLLTCRLSTHTCEVTVPAQQDGTRVVPGP